MEWVYFTIFRAMTVSTVLVVSFFSYLCPTLIRLLIQFSRPLIFNINVLRCASYIGGVSMRSVEIWRLSSVRLAFTSIVVLVTSGVVVRRWAEMSSPPFPVFPLSFR